MELRIGVLLSPAEGSQASSVSLYTFLGLARVCLIIIEI